MGKRGPKPDPIERKRARGTARADRTPNMANLAAVPALEDVDDTMAGALEFAAEHGSWLAASDKPSVLAARDALERLARLDADPKATEKDKALWWDRAWRAFQALGFSPAERTQLGLAEVKAASKLEQLKAKHGE